MPLGGYRDSVWCRLWHTKIVTTENWVETEWHWPRTLGVVPWSDSGCELNGRKIDFTGIPPKTRNSRFDVMEAWCSSHKRGSRGNKDHKIEPKTGRRGLKARAEIWTVVLGARRNNCAVQWLSRRENHCVQSIYRSQLAIRFL